MNVVGIPADQLACPLRSMMSAFGSGAAFSLVSGMTAGNKLQGAFTTGVLFALFQGAFYQARAAHARLP
jgi:hypothetical protein